MSRIGKKLIEIPKEVEVEVEGQRVTVRSKKGQLSRELRSEIKIEKVDHQIIVQPKEHLENSEKELRSLWGLTRTLISNMVDGVAKGFEKRLEIEGIGYRANVEGDTLVLHVGHSHPIQMKTPGQITVTVDKNLIIVSGIEKEKVGEFAARIRAQRRAEPYKGKGIKYTGEYVRRKLGKKAVVASGAGKAK